MMHIDYSALDNCKNLYDSYGEICVRCNACGRFDKTTQKECELRILKNRLQENAEFDRWDTYPEWRKIQEKNVKANEKYLKKQIAKLEKEINPRKEQP